MTLIYKGFLIEPGTTGEFRLKGVSTPILKSHKEARQYINYLLIYNPAFNGGYGVKSARKCKLQ
jgi:hypothetical protein